MASESYGFDPFGNLINYNGRTLSVLGTTNRLSAAGYDASGNMTAWNGFSFSWDALDRMTALVGNGLARRFAFTADGERVLEREGSSYSFSLRGIDNRVLREMKATWTGAGWSWAWEKDSIWGAGRLVASVSASDGIRHAHVDHLGSPRLLTNRCGQRVALLDHNPWGLDRPTGVQDGERHRFTAHQRDLGLLDHTWDDFDYMHARYYNPNVARFLSVDPVPQIRRSQSTPQFWNRYAYAAGNPLKYTDPTGRVAVLQGSEDEQKKTLQSLRDGIPVELRMFVRTTTNQQGQTVIDTRYLRMASAPASGNFQALSSIASSDKIFSLSTSATSAATTTGTVTLGANSMANGIFLDDGGLSTVNHTSFVLVGGDLSRRDKATTLAHEIRHASLFAQGRPYDHEMGLFEVSPGVYNAYDPNGPVNRATASAEREAEASFEPFYPLR